MPTNGISERKVLKGIAHKVIMTKIKNIYKRDNLNVSELSRLCDIPYDRLRRLLFHDLSWGADEWFKVMVVCGAEGGVPQMYRTTLKELAKYQKSLRYRKLIPKTPGPTRGYKHKELKCDESIESFD